MSGSEILMKTIMANLPAGTDEFIASIPKIVKSVSERQVRIEDALARLSMNLDRVEIALGRMETEILLQSPSYTVELVNDCMGINGRAEGDNGG
jgi:hypothetical protein